MDRARAVGNEFLGERNGAAQHRGRDSLDSRALSRALQHIRFVDSEFDLPVQDRLLVARKDVSNP